MKLWHCIFGTVKACNVIAWVIIVGPCKNLRTKLKLTRLTGVNKIIVIIIIINIIIEGPIGAKVIITNMTLLFSVRNYRIICQVKSDSSMAAAVDQSQYDKSAQPPSYQQAPTSNLAPPTNPPQYQTGHPSTAPYAGQSTHHQAWQAPIPAPQPIYNAQYIVQQPGTYVYQTQPQTLQVRVIAMALSYTQLRLI